MTPTEPPDADSGPPEITCDDAFELTRIFATKKLPTSEVKKLRAHLARCPECMDRYREAVNTTAALGRSTRAEREKRAIERERWALHAKVFGTPAGEAKPRKKARNYRLRLVLMPALFIYLVTQITGLGPPPARVLITEARGVVSVDERRVDEAVESTLVLPGRWVKTQRFAAAKLDGRTCLLDLEASTDLLVEAAAPPRFRLRQGGFSLEGSATLVTVLGLLEVEEGRGHLRLDDRGLEIEPQSGRWVWFDRSGETLLENGRAIAVTPEVNVAELGK